MILFKFKVTLTLTFDLDLNINKDHLQVINNLPANNEGGRSNGFPVINWTSFTTY